MKNPLIKKKDKTLLDKHIFCINIDVQGVILGNRFM